VLTVREHFEDRESFHVAEAALLLANAVLLALLSLEVNDYFAAHVTSGDLPAWLDASDARQMTLSVLWAGYGLALIMAGLLRR